MDTNPKQRSSPPLLFVLLHSLCLGFSALGDTPIKSYYSMVVFGDSSVDAGNNNFINTSLKSNFPPYGKDLKSHLSSGRFSNGRLATDITASSLGIKDTIPPYLDPTLSVQDLLTGVSFASAGSGFDPLTATFHNVMDIPTQLKHFKEYKCKIEITIGKNKTEDHIRHTIFNIHAGTNDFMVTYYSSSKRKNYTPFEYMQFIISQVNKFVQDLVNEGAQFIIVSGLYPMGCVPKVVVSHPGQQGCMEIFNATAREYNKMLANEVNLMQTKLEHQGTNICYFDVYTPFEKMVKEPILFGFCEVFKPCCENNSNKNSALCAPNSNVCLDASKYVFFDMIHLTEEAYSHISQNVIPLLNNMITRHPEQTQI